MNTEINFFKVFYTGKKYNCFQGAAHGDDISYLFHTIFGTPPSIDSREFKAIKKMVSGFSSFSFFFW